MEEKYIDFKKAYMQRLKEYYNTLLNRKNKIAIRYIIILLGLDIIFILFSFMFFYNFEYLKYISIILGTIVLVVSCIIGILKSLKKEKMALVDKIIFDIVQFISKDEKASFEPNRRISKESIDKMELFDLTNLNYSGKNVIQAIYNNNPMSFSDVSIFHTKMIEREEVYYDKEGNKKTRIVKDKVKKYVFSGCYISAKLNKKIPEHIYLIPNNISDLFINGKIKDFITYDGEEVELENLEFSQKYKVYSNDEIQARYVLSIKLMEKIMDIDKYFENKKFIVFKEDGRFAICIHNYSIQDIRETYIPSSYTSNKLDESLKHIFKNIYNLFNIYNILDLGNDLYIS